MKLSEVMAQPKKQTMNLSQVESNATPFKPFAKEGAFLLGAGQSLPVTDEIGAALGAGLSGVVGAAADMVRNPEIPSLGQFTDRVASNYDKSLDATRGQIKQAASDNPLEYYGGMIAGSIGTGGAGATTKAGALLGNSLRSGNLAMRTAKAAGAGATSMGLYGFGSKEGGFDNRTKGMGEDLATGAVLGVAAPIIGSALKATGSAIIPKLDTATKSLASRAKDLGIDLRLDQLSPTRARRLVQKISQDIPLSGVDSFDAKQQSQWMRGLSKTIGLDTDNLNPAAIDTFLTNANNKFGVLTKGKSIPVLPATVKLIDRAAASAKGNVTDDIAALVEKNAAAIKAELADGVVNGNKLAAVRSNLIKRLPSINPQARPYVQEFVDAMDVSVNKVLTKAERETLKTARREWRNFKTIEPLLEKSTDGMINPTDLAARVASSKFIKASRTSTGSDELVDLARIGKKFLPKAGGSDTQPKLLYGAGGAGAASVVLNPALALPVAATTGAVVGGNRAFQSGYNASQGLVNRAINATDNAAPLLRGNASAIAGTLPPRDPMPPIIEGQSPTSITINPAMQGREGVPDVNLPQAQGSVLFDKIAGAEASGDMNIGRHYPDDPSKSASGPAGFIDGTWRSMVKRYGKEYGISFKDKNNPQAQRIMTELLANEHRLTLGKMLGREPTDGELYLAHFAGSNGTRRLLRAPENAVAARLLPKAASANRPIFYDENNRPRKVGEVLELVKGKVI